MTVTNRNGKVCYLEIPALDVAASASFYRDVFGWTLRTRGDGATSFDDGVEVSGAWTTARKPSRDVPAVVVYVMVKDAAATLEAIVARGGEVVHPVEPHAPEITALFRDPAGNVVGIYQERALSGG
jgi:uncharacterized protein